VKVESQAKEKAVVPNLPGYEAAKARIPIKMDKAQNKPVKIKQKKVRYY